MSTGGTHGTHAIELGPHRVVKRFRAGDREEGEREWRALQLLAGHAPGLAPAPLAAELGAEEPAITMSRLPGRRMRDRPHDGRALDALAEAVRTLHSALPPAVLADVPPRPGLAHDLRAHLRSWASRVQVPRRGEVGAAMDLGLRWLDRSDMESAAEDVPPVFGAGDGNLANYLWDGSRVRIVDFEDSGRSDRAFELAEITEHVGSWVVEPLDVRAFLSRFALTAQESARLRDCRRLLALVWLFLLSFDEERERPRNPPGTVERQARRLTARLS